MQEISVDIDGAVATVTLSRPEALNALTPTMLGELNTAFDGIREDARIRVAVLTGAGRAFSAGVDLKSLGARELPGGAVGEVLDVPGRHLLANLETMPAIVIARVNGFCFTGALELLLACDLIITAEDAKFGDTHARWGIRPSWGMSQRLPRRVGVMKARELSYTARTFSGVEAAAMGLANVAVPRDELDGTVASWCEQILTNSPGTLAAYKDLYRSTEDLPLDQGLAYEVNTSYPIHDTGERLKEFLSR
jgi:enoyl-CoA hydratase/carnithine racemase